MVVLLANPLLLRQPNMKTKIVVSLLALTMAGSAIAEGYYVTPPLGAPRREYNHPGHPAFPIFPALIGGVIGYELAQPRMYSAPPVYVAPQPPVLLPQVQWYCPTTRDYYPNVPVCDVPWLKVVP